MTASGVAILGREIYDPCVKIQERSYCRSPEPDLLNFPFLESTSQPSIDLLFASCQISHLARRQVAAAVLDLLIDPGLASW